MAKPFFRLRVDMSTPDGVDMADHDSHSFSCCIARPAEVPDEKKVLASWEADREDVERASRALVSAVEFVDDQLGGPGGGDVVLDVVFNLFMGRGDSGVWVMLREIAIRREWRKVMARAIEAAEKHDEEDRQ